MFIYLKDIMDGIINIMYSFLHVIIKNNFKMGDW